MDMGIEDAKHSSIQIMKVLIQAIFTITTTTTTTTTKMKSLKVHLATSSRGKERLHRPQLSKSLVGWLDPVDNHIKDNADVKELSEQHSIMKQFGGSLPGLETTLKKFQSVTPQL